MEKTILFNTEMVKAILEGRKTSTRRIIKPQPTGKTLNSFLDGKWLSKKFGNLLLPRISDLPMESEYQVGGTLYVRETFNSDWCNHTIYKADGGSAKEAGYAEEPRWHPSIHMPREAARIFLKVTDVKAERLQDITEKEALKEGIRAFTKDNKIYKYSATDDFIWQNAPHTAKEAFKTLWNSTVNKKDLDKYGWDANPFCWVIEFERIEKPKEMKG